MADGHGTDGSVMHMPAHERTYLGFLGLIKYGAIASFIVAATVVYLISH